MSAKRTIGVVLFEDFELLDVFGPLEMYGMAPDAFEIRLVAAGRDAVASRQGPRSAIDDTFAERTAYDLLLVPGGAGTRPGVEDPDLVEWLRRAARDSEWVTSVCTGSALLARAGALDGRRATTNKRAFEWVASQGPRVEWVKQARWVEDGRFFTSSGVSAGMDMALAIIAKLLGAGAAEAAANRAEYEWHRDPGRDPFAALHGLA